MSRIGVKKLVVLALAVALQARGDVIGSWTGAQTLADNDASGWAYTFSLPDNQTWITDVNVALAIDGGFNGDLYAYLVHGSGFALLLNRVGRDTGMPYGYADAGFNIVLDDQAPLYLGTTDPDIHRYQTMMPVYSNGVVTGTWQPDARFVTPTAVLAGSPRTADFSTFNGLNPAGNWTVFVADLSAGGVATLRGVTVDATLVPEPSGLLLGLLGAFAAIRRRAAK